MSYKKFLKSVTLPSARLGVKSQSSTPESANIYQKYKNFLPVVYQGPSNRNERYTIYDGMEQDPVISWSLDTITDFIIQSDKDQPFKVNYKNSDDMTDSQTTTIERELDEWIEYNGWKKRIYSTVRDILKYGDILFIRDPETFELQRVNIYDIMGVVVDDLKVPTHYIIKNVDLNVPLKLASASVNDVTTKNLLNTINSNFTSNVNTSNASQLANSNPTDDQTKLPIEAKHVVHISMNIDNILLYPFGVSVLENIYKPYIQKMLLQDCVLLYRIKNATEKLVYNIPVGQVPRYKRKEYMEKIKNELSQRRMPSKDSDGVFNTIDVAYNSIPMNEDFFLPVDADGVQPKIEKLAAGQNLGEINDLVYWENLLIRGLKVPQSWVPYGPTDGQRTMPTNTSNTYVQELRFFKYCCRLQNIIVPELDKEFKLYLRYKGIMVDNNSFSLEFNEPSNITELTEEEICVNRLNAFGTAVGNPYISNQFALKKYLKLTEEEYNENQRLLIQENQERFKDKNVDLPTEDTEQTPGLRTVGIENIPMDYLNDMQQDMNMSLGGMSAPTGGDMGGLGIDSSTGMGMGADSVSGGLGNTPTVGGNSNTGM